MKKILYHALTDILISARGVAISWIGQSISMPKENSKQIIICKNEIIIDTYFFKNNGEFNSRTYILIRELLTLLTNWRKAMRAPNSGVLGAYNDPP